MTPRWSILRKIIITGTKKFPRFILDFAAVFGTKLNTSGRTPFAIKTSMANQAATAGTYKDAMEAAGQGLDCSRILLKSHTESQRHLFWL